VLLATSPLLSAVSHRNARPHRRILNPHFLLLVLMALF
jgi:hypothetical protein